MARQPRLTVQVQSQQFQQFAAQFNAFSGQIRRLNQQFTQINQSLQRTNILVRGVQATMQGLLGVTKSVGSEVWKITKNFISWSTIIGGVTALLGMGGGLFGIERLAASILAKRRQVLGLGGDYGRTQASMIFSQGLIGSPGEVLKNIRMGMAGDPERQRGLLAAGINPFAGGRMDPDEVMDKLVQKSFTVLNQAGPGNELRMAKAYGLDQFFDPMTLLRLSTKEGQEEYKVKMELTKQYKEQLKITPRALRAWSELEIQFQAAKASLESAFGESLADLAEPLKELSQGFANIIRTLIKTPEMQKFIAWLAEQIHNLADKMNKLSEKDISDYIQKVKDALPSLEEFESYMDKFVNILKSAVKILNLFIPAETKPEPALPTGAQGYKDETGTGLRAAPYGRELSTGIRQFFGGTGAAFREAPVVPGAMATGQQNVRPFNAFGQFDPNKQDTYAPPGSNWSSTTINLGRGAQAIPPSIFANPFSSKDTSGVFPNPPGYTPQAPPAPPTSKSGITPPSTFGAPGTPAPSITGGAPSTFGAPGTPAPSITGGAPSTFGSWLFGKSSLAPGVGYNPSADPFGAGASATMDTWSNAATKMAPPTPNPADTGKDSTGTNGAAKLGPLSYNNWQSSRVANLVVRNVPGSNIFMTAAGMTG